MRERTYIVHLVSLYVSLGEGEAVANLATEKKYFVRGVNSYVESAADGDYLVIKAKDGTKAFMAPAHQVRACYVRQQKCAVTPLAKVPT